MTTVDFSGFLGNSQTFTGVLISILVLCILVENKDADESNILHRLITDALARRKRKIASIFTEYGNTPQPSVYKQSKSERKKVVEKINSLQKFISNADEGKKLVSAPEKVKTARILRNELSISTFSQFALTAADEKTINEHMKKFGDIRYPGMASFYCLLFGLLIFIVDEVVIYFPSTIDYAVSFILLVTLLSYALWIMLWIKFIHNFEIPRLYAQKQKFQFKQESHPKIFNCIKSLLKRISPILQWLRQLRCARIFQWMREFRCKRNFRFWILLLIYLCWFTLIIIMSRFIPDCRWQLATIYGFGIALPILALGIIMTFGSKQDYRPTYENMGIHLCEFSALSTVCIALIFGSVAIQYLPDTIIFHWRKSNLILLKFAVDIFILVNGLILAYAVPVSLMGKVPKYIRYVATERIKAPVKKRHQVEKNLITLIEEIPAEDLE